MNENDRQVLQALGEAREQHRELADLLDFYQNLYECQFEIKGQIPGPKLRPTPEAKARLERGIPQVSFDQLCLEPAQFASIVSRVTEIFLRHNPVWAAERADWTEEALLALANDVFEQWEISFAHNPGQTGDGETRADGLGFLVVSLALSPYLLRAADEILPRLDLSLWTRGYCPVCGGKPNLALLDKDTNTRQLMCSRCAGMWRYVRVGCPFCRVKEKQVYYPSESGLHRLYVCRRCQRYLKTVDLDKAESPILPMVERLLTINMDLAAQQEGWGENTFQLLK